MRILGFSKKWDKLRQPDFTTFRFPRRDKDWEVGEQVRVVYKPRTKEREVLGIAKIIGKERCWVGWATTLIHWIHSQKDILPGRGGWGTVSHKEAVEDGFSGVLEMIQWMSKTHKDRNNQEIMNKLTLQWVEEIVRAADKAGIPVFLKNNLMPLILQHAKDKNAKWADRILDSGGRLRQGMPNP